MGPLSCSRKLSAPRSVSPTKPQGPEQARAKAARASGQTLGKRNHPRLVAGQDLLVAAPPRYLHPEILTRGEIYNTIRKALLLTLAASFYLFRCFCLFTPVRQPIHRPGSGCSVFYSFLPSAAGVASRKGAASLLGRARQKVSGLLVFGLVFVRFFPQGPFFS